MKAKGVYVEDLIDSIKSFRYQKIDHNATKYFLEYCCYIGLEYDFSDLRDSFVERDKVVFKRELERSLRETNWNINSLSVANVPEGVEMFEHIREKLKKIKIFYSNVDF